MSLPTISTKTGDDGSTSLYGGTRVSKADDRIQAYGDIDELNAVLGMILAEEGLPTHVIDQLKETQQTLFVLGADLATPLEGSTDVPRITAQHVSMLEAWGAALEADLPPLTHFILPSGAKAGCSLHLARTICRRAERWMVALGKQADLNPQAMIYVNRLSDYLFLAARTVNQFCGKEEREWIRD